MGNFKKISAFPVYALCFHETFRDKSIERTENGLERGFVKQWLDWANSFTVIFAAIVLIIEQVQVSIYEQVQVSIYVH